MGLFSTSWFQKYESNDSRSSTRNKHRSRRHKHRDINSVSDLNAIRSQDSLPDNVHINIGEERPFSMRIENLYSMRRLSRTHNSTCILLMYTNDQNREVLSVRWSTVQRDASSRDHISSRLAAEMTDVPRYRFKDVFRYYNKYVCVGIRSFIDGVTLGSELQYMSQDEIDAIFMQVQAISMEMSRKTSMYFGHINDGGFRSTTPIGFIRTHSMFDKLKGINTVAEWQETGTDSYTSLAVFCHGALTPDHIIIKDTEVKGIVGWSNADFVPEAYDRLTYYFLSNPSSSLRWSRDLSEMLTSEHTRQPSVEFVLNLSKYVYVHALNTSPSDKRYTIKRLWNTLTMNYTIVNCLSAAAQIESDNMSLSSLSSWNSTTVQEEKCKLVD